MSKIKMAKEIQEAMAFFNIPSEEFSTIKNRFGSLEAMHEYFSNQF